MKKSIQSLTWLFSLGMLFTMGAFSKAPVTAVQEGATLIRALEVVQSGRQMSISAFQKAVGASSVAEAKAAQAFATNFISQYKSRLPQQGSATYAELIATVKELNLSPSATADMITNIAGQQRALTASNLKGLVAASSAVASQDLAQATEATGTLIFMKEFDNVVAAAETENAIPAPAMQEINAYRAELVGGMDSQVNSTLVSRAGELMKAAIANGRPAAAIATLGHGVRGYTKKAADGGMQFMRNILKMTLEGVDNVRALGNAAIYLGPTPEGKFAPMDPGLNGCFLTGKVPA